MASPRICSLEGCGKRHVACGFCDMHYTRFRKYGDPLGGSTFRGAPEIFYQTVVLTCASDECLIWPYSRGSDGYARIKRGDAQQLVQRLVCFTLHGPPPTGDHEAAHSCGQGMRGCVNPRHVRWATREENAGDKLTHGTAPRGTKCGLAKLTDADVRSIRQLKRAGWANSWIADRFGISKTAVSNINTGITWGWLKD